MGSYDMVNIRCPRCGDAEVEFQSKSGACNFEEYDLDSAPAEVLVGIIDQIKVCNNCHYNIHIERYQPRQKIVKVV